MTGYESLVSLYDRHATAMENVAPFYEWVLDVFRLYGVPTTASVQDVGCGTGTLLAKLYQAGYRDLSGLDFSQGCLNIAASQAVPLRLFQHDVVHGPAAGVYDVIFATGVIDFVVDPLAALGNIRHSLRTDSLLFISIRNLNAYAPWYHLAPLGGKLASRPRAKHWFYQLTTPLSLRRDEYPVDNMFTPAQMRALLRASGLSIVGEHSSMILPMLWIWDIPRLVAVMKRVDSLIRWPSQMGYRYMFVCRRS